MCVRGVQIENQPSEMNESIQPIKDEMLLKKAAETAPFFERADELHAKLE